MQDKSNSVVIFNARIIGAFFLLAFLAYGLGSQLFESNDNLEKYL
jgi:hypothetical protein